MDTKLLPTKPKQRQSFYRVAWTLYGLACLLPYLIGVYLILELKVHVTYIIINILALTLILILLGALMIELFSTRLRYLSDRIAFAIHDGATHTLVVEDNDLREIDMLTRGFNAIIGEQERHKKRAKDVTAKMLAYMSELETLEKRSREELLIRANLSRYVGTNVVDELIRKDKSAFENVECTATILFADIRGFTAVSEHMEPEEVISMLNNYFNKMVPVIFKYGGVLDKFVGDELMAVFRDTTDGEQAVRAEPAALRAVQAAIHMVDTLEEMKSFRGSKYSMLEVGIGINTGRVVIGNVGSENRKDYTAIGDTVNVAARFEQLASNQEIIVGEETYKICKDHVPMEHIGEIALKNRGAAVRRFRVIKKGEKA
ncbi:MAG: adenylate/guanylate cyclase domain-containing protein [Mariprofundaceae bacterium]|nr:adenylate/guanylate cyclase domain-containing protein [Mariprofundaceae bacterium]